MAENLREWVCDECDESRPLEEFDQNFDRCIWCRRIEDANGNQKKQITSEKNFRSIVDKIGGVVIGDYLECHIPIDIICPKGHHSRPISNNVCRGQGVCSICACNHKDSAEKKFIDNILFLGGKVLGKYINAHTRVDCICINNHLCNPMPNDVQQGQGICKKCVSHDSEQAEKEFHDNINSFGGIVIGKYMKSVEAVDCICPVGHNCRPIPNNIQQGAYMCKICLKLDKETAQKNFEEMIEKEGGLVIGKYKNNHTCVDCICPEGHNCRPIPGNIQQGAYMCKICLKLDKETAERNFSQTIENEGGLIMGNYKNCYNPVVCVCPKGHMCMPSPTNVQRGQGMCAKCMYCPSCGLFRTNGKLCEFCKPKNENKHYEKTKEMKVVKYLREKFPDQEFIHNKSVGSQCTESHLFPDVLFDMGFYNIIIEVDEHKHRGSSYKCEKQRMHDIIAKLGMPCIFIRYNPDSKLSDMDKLVETITAHMSYTLEDHNLPCDDFGFFCEYLFY